jgi:hypothetical protein
MATTFVDYNGDGNATKSFSFPSIKEADIKVEVDEVIKSVGTHYNITGYSTTGGGDVVFIDNSGSGGTNHIPQGASGSTPAAQIRIFRDTDVDSAKATFTAGSSVKAGDLNINNKQLLYSAQEEQNQTIQTSKIKDSAVTSAKIREDAVITAKIADDNVTMAKLGSGALPTDITVASANLVNGTIVDADVNASAAIAGTKVTPAFGSQNVSTSGTAATGALTVTGNIAVSGTVDGRDVATDGSKLDGIDVGAKDDQTAAEIRVLVEAATDSNVFTDADHSKLNAIEPSATADQTNAEIKTAYEANANTNEFSDAEQTKLANIETAATADQTASEIKTLLQSDKLTLSEINTTSTDSRYFTETESDARYFRQDSTETIASGDTWSSADTHIATTGAINARIVDLIDDVGGFTAITSEQHFPNSNPQGSTGQAAILSIQAASTTLTPSGTTVTITNGNLANNADITITGVSAAIPTGFGFLVESTSTLHEYSFHRLVPKATEVTTVAGIASAISTAATNVADINNFSDIYIISSSEPTQRADGSSLQEGDLWYDSSNDNLLVYTGSAFSIITPSQSVLDDVAIVSGAITYSEDLGLITSAVSTGSSNGSLDIVADALEDEITFTVTAATGKFIIDGVDKPALTLYKGWTYTFDVSDNSNAAHPLRFSSGGSAYNTGVTVTGTQGQAGAKVQLVVPESQPTSFAYYCTAHSGMGNTITVKDDPIKTVSDSITNINAVAGNSTNINAVAADATDIGAVAAKATEIGRLGTADAVADMAILGTTDVVADLNTLGTADIVSDMNTLAVSGVISDMDTCATNVSNINTVGGAITNVNTVANNISNVNSFAGTYQIASSAPSTDGAGNALAAGDLYFDTTANELRVHNGSTFQGGVTATGNLAGLGANTFTGSQTVNANIIVTGTVDGRDVAADGTKLDGIEASATADQTASEIVSLISGQTIAPNVITTTNLTLDFGTLS